VNFIEYRVSFGYPTMLVMAVGLNIRHFQSALRAQLNTAVTGYTLVTYAEFGLDCQRFCGTTALLWDNSERNPRRVRISQHFAAVLFLYVRASYPEGIVFEAFQLSYYRGVYGKM